MNNNLIMWSMFFVPWLTLFFMEKDEIKRWFPVGLAAVVSATIIHDVGTTLGFWATIQPTFPFNEMLPYFFGTMPVLTIWVFKFTYGRFWMYMLVNLVLDIGFNFFLLSYFLPLRGVYEFNILPLFSLPITLGHAIVIYTYQLWQDNAFLSFQNIKNYNLQPSAAKPLHNDDDKKD